MSTRVARGMACHRFEGDLDRTSLEGLALEPVRDASWVELDLRRVAYVDAAGLHAIVDLADAYAQVGAVARVTVSSPVVLRAFDAVGLIDSCDVHVARPADR